jgi:hypothetical protein
VYFLKVHCSTRNFEIHWTVPDIDTTNKIAIVHTNLVAPIIIKNCNEEYQHVSNFEDPIVYGRLAEHITEHPLVQVRPTSYVLLHAIWAAVRKTDILIFNLEVSDLLSAMIARLQATLL